MKFLLSRLNIGTEILVKNFNWKDFRLQTEKLQHYTRSGYIFTFMGISFFISEIFTWRTTILYIQFNYFQLFMNNKGYGDVPLVKVPFSPQPVPGRKNTKIERSFLEMLGEKSKILRKIWEF